MGKLFLKIKEIWKTLDTSIYTGKQLENNLNALTSVSVFSAFLGFTMFILDILTGQSGMIIAAVAACISGVLCAFIAGKLKNREVAVVIPTVFCAVVFTFYTMNGTADGAGMLWTLIVPIGISYFVSVKYGILLSVYYSVFFAIICYTPVGCDMKQYFTPTFISRFPIVYFSTAVFTIVAMVQYHTASLKARNYESDLKQEVEELTRQERERRKEVEAMSLHTVQTLANAIDAKDRYTKGHSFRVSEYSAILARELGMDKQEVEVLRLEALLHDIGKIGIPDSILNKPGRLSDIEFHIIQSHTEMGAKILQNIETLEGAKSVALSHHEKYDGTGYPQKLAGKDIPLHARIIGIADAYDAMHSTRIYRPALSEAEVHDELIHGRGTQFDPTFLDCFLKLLDEGKMVVDATHNDAVNLEDYSTLPLETLSREVQEVVEQLPEVSKTMYEGRYAMNYDEFQRVYAYVQAMAERYKLQFQMVMINITPKADTQVSQDRQQAATEALATAIRRTAREVDVCAQCSDTQVLGVFLGTELPNVEKIMDRVINSYFKIFDGSEFDIQWETSPTKL